MNTALFLQSIKQLGLSNEQLKVVSELGKACFESASSTLFHFTNVSGLLGIAKSDTFKLSGEEADMNGMYGNNFMSFSRTGSFREGYPIVLHSEFGFGDDWCMIRISVDGDKLNDMPRIKYRNKTHKFTVRPFDYIHASYGDDFGDEFEIDERIDSGKEWMMASDGDDDHKVPVGSKTEYNPAGYRSFDRENHPYSQAEDRLFSTAPRIPKASSLIKSIDIVLVRDNFNDTNLANRKELAQALDTKAFFRRTPWHIYDNIRMFYRHIPSEQSPQDLLLPNHL